MKRPLLILGLVLLAALVALVLLLRKRALLRAETLLEETTPTTTVPSTPTTTPPTTPAPTTPAFAFTGETKYGYTDGQQIANHGTSYPVFARVVNGVLYAVGLNKTEGQALYNVPVTLSRAWLGAMGQFGTNVNAFTDKAHQQTDPAPLSAFQYTLPNGSAAIQPQGYSPTTTTPPSEPVAPVLPPAPPSEPTAPTIPSAPPSEPVASTPPPEPTTAPPISPVEEPGGDPITDDDFTDFSMIPAFEDGLNAPLTQPV
jgi:hypothetical protein